MRIRIFPIVIAVFAIASLSPAVQAQRAGFVTAGIPVVNSPVMPFVSSPVTPFGVIPAITPPIISTFPAPNFFFNTNAGFGVANVQPVPIVVGPPFIPNSGVTVIVPQTNFIAPVVVAPTAAPAPPVRRPFHVPAGTPRAQVIQQLGAPAVTIVTRDGEVLGFSSGVTIYLQNGIVVIR